MLSARSRDMETLRSTPEPWGYQTLDSNIGGWRTERGVGMNAVLVCGRAQGLDFHEHRGAHVLKQSLCWLTSCGVTTIGFMGRVYCGSEFRRVGIG